MTLSDTSIRRPVLAIVINLIIFMAGVVGLEGLAVRQLPKFDLPTVTIKTIYPGAAPDLIERLITTPIEQAVASIDGIDVMSSTSAENFSKIQVKFKISKDANVAAEQVRASVSSVLGDLPDDAKAPKITRQTADAQPVIYLAFKSEKYSPLEITDMISRRVKPILATVDGVATAQIFGERRYALRIWLDEGKMNGYGITISDIVQALRTQNVDLPSGSIGNSARTITVLTDTALKTPEAFKAITLSTGKDYVIRLEDVARVEVGADSVDTSVRVNGNDAVSVGIIRQSSANPLDLATSLKGKMEAIKGVLPQGVSVDIVFDSTLSLVASIEEVKETLVEAIIIVIAVVYLFLGSWRALFVTLMTIPISLVGTFGFLYMLDYSINTFTLLAIVLAIGLVVDDAIVMLENINRYIEEGMNPIKAAFKGSREIAFAILVMTMTLAAVYAPIGLASGLLGVLFREFAFTLTIAVIISGLVAITLSPMMCSRLLKADGRKPKLLEAFDRRIDHLTKRYSQLLSWGLTKKKYMVGVILLVSLAGFSLAGHLKSAFIPTEDQGYLL
ncbi:MAG: efflux RND transporter permease subunit, partial [Methylococcales bacterium]|nr:efflux RND transporter permease subunit [Methylococcales bacterium]